MKNKTLVVVMMALIAVFTSLSLKAQEEKRFEIIENTKESDIGYYTDMAMDLVEDGYKNSSAASLVQAAAIFTAIPTQPLTLTDVQQGKKKHDDIASNSYDPAKLMADAKAMAGNDKKLQGRINEFESRLKDQVSTKAMSVTSIGQKQIRVDARSSRVVYFEASVPNARYCVRAKGTGTRLKMTVSSTWANGDDKGTAEGTTPALSFWIGPTQQVKVVVANYGDKPNFCSLVLEKIADPDQIVNTVEGVVNTVEEVTNTVNEVVDLFYSIFGD